MSGSNGKNISSSAPLKIGCISSDKVNELNQTKGYFTKIAGLMDQDSCLKKAAALGALCNLDSTQPCQYIARPSSLNSGDQGECYLIGHDGNPLAFNQTLYDNVSQNNCQTTGDLTKILAVSTTNPTGYKEEQKKIAYQEVKNLQSDISQKQSQLSQKEFHIKCLQSGKDDATCMKEQAKNNLDLQRETEMKNVLLVNEKFKQVNDDQQMYADLQNQKDKRQTEVSGNLEGKKRRLKGLNATLQTKTQLINFNNEIYQDNNQTVYYLNLIIFFLVILSVGIVFYINFEKITGIVGDVANKININMPNLGLGQLNNFSNVKLRNLKNFSF